MSFTFSGLLSRSYNNNISMVDNYWETCILRSDNGGGDDHGESFSSIIYPSYSDFPPGFNPNHHLLDAFPSESNGEPQRNMDTIRIHESVRQVDFSPSMRRNLFERHSTSVPQVNYGKSVNKDLDGDLNDGYNWRKYGEKEVKGGENPRYYYRCTQPNCTMKKKVGRNSNGDVIEVIYKGSHNHPKPWKPLEKLQSLDALTPLTNPRNMSQQSTREQDLNRIIEQASQITSHPRRGDEDQLEAHAKRLKGVSEVYSYCFYPIGGKPIKEPRVIVQTTTEIDILDDGYRWRKYGQKIVKGNPNPRNYYKCVSEGCNVRKHVERAAHDIKSVITTYEGKHNHQVPEQPSFPTRHISFTPLTSLNNFATSSSSSSSPRLSNNQNSSSDQQPNNLPLRIGGIQNFGRSLIGTSTSYATEGQGPTSNK